MDPEFVAILQKLIAEQGKETLFNTAKCKALLSDYTRGEYKKESRLLLQALDAEVQKAIDKAENIAICKKQQIRTLSEDYSLAEEKAAEVVDTLALVLRGDTSRTEIRKEEPPPPPAPPVPTPIGSIIPFGSYKWRVLDVQGDEKLIITEDIIEKRPCNEKFTDVTWETCTLRGYLNGTFYNTFGEVDKKRIIEKRIPNPDNLWYGTKGGRDTQDKIFLLSLEEVDKYFGDSGDYLNKRRKTYDSGKWIAASDGSGFSNNHDVTRVANYEGKACWWWLRSPGSFSLNAAYVYFDGIVFVNGDSVYYSYGGVRPALWLHL